jgi:hypothetical protein
MYLVFALLFGMIACGCGFLLADFLRYKLSDSLSLCSLGFSDQ